MTAIMKRELGSYFNSAIGYIVLAVFYFFSGMFFYLYCLLSNTASMNYLFLSMLMIVMLIIPIITMRSFSEEKRQKTDQALLTAPVSLTEIVMGKFLGAFLLFALCSVIFLIYAVVISFFAQPQWSVILCTFVGLMLLGSAFIAINVFISSLTESMIVAAVAGMAIGLLVDMMTYFINAINVDWITAILEKINFINYYQNFTYGVLSPVDIVFFLSVTALFLFFTVRVLEKRRWS